MAAHELAPEPNALALEPFLVDGHSARSLLQRMASSQAAAALTLGERRSAPRVSCTVLGVEAARVALWCRREPDTDGEAFVVGLLDRYKIQFPARRLRLADAGALRLAAPPAEGVVLQCEFPDRLWRINRRETFRVAASPRLGVDVVIGGERPQNYRLVDLGLGGMAFEVPAGDERPLAVGDRLEPCWLTGEEMVSHPFALVVRSVVAGSGDRPRRRVGASLAAEDALVTRDLQLAMYRLEAARRGR